MPKISPDFGEVALLLLKASMLKQKQCYDGLAVTRKEVG